jgi:hypothetical protein
MHFKRRTETPKAVTVVSKLPIAFRYMINVIGVFSSGLFHFLEKKDVNVSEADAVSVFWLRMTHDISKDSV